VATVWQVDRLDDPALPTGNACTVAANDCTLRGAVSVANSGDTVELSVPGTILLQSAVVLTKDLTITSASAVNHVIDGDNTNVIFSINANQTIRLNELTLQNGYNSNSGGAVSMSTGTLTMTHVVLQDNVALDKGGALAAMADPGTANVYLTDVDFLNNHAIDDFESGGAIYAYSGDFSAVNMFIEDARFENNIGGVFTEATKDGYGGAISASTLDQGARLSLEIRSSEFISNGSALGGALYFQSYNRNDTNSSETHVLIDDSRFAQNHADTGGAINISALDQASATTVVISNSTFISNTADDRGGAIYHRSLNRGDPEVTRVTLAIHNSTLSNNQAGGGGGAIYSAAVSNFGEVFSLASVELVNVTLSGNRAANGNGGALFASSSGLINATNLMTATQLTAFDNSLVGGSDIRAQQALTSEVSIYLKNSVVGGSAGASCTNDEATISGANNLISDTSCGSDTSFRLDSPVGIIPTLADNGGPTLTHGLYAGSNALDAVPAGQCTIGNTATPVATDQRGEARPFGSACDIGSFEAQTVTLPIAPIAGLTANNDGPTTLKSPTAFTATLTSGVADSYTWDFGDGTGDTGISPTHTYTQSGVYTATVVAADASSTLTATTVVYVGDVVVKVVNNSFDPKEVTVSAGDKVVWVLINGFHSVTADDGSFEQPAGSDWQPFIHNFATPGTFAYYCSIHGAKGGIGMSGTVTVMGEDAVPNDLRLPYLKKS
jgi:predicted outer membrane repeat protein